MDNKIRNIFKLSLYIYIFTCGHILSISGLELDQKDIFPPKTENIPLIDGKINEPMWENAYKIKNFVNNHSPVPAVTPTEAFICYDDFYLYFAFKCYEPNIEKLINERYETERDAEIAFNDCVEIFIDTEHNHLSCYHFILSAKGVQADESWNNVNWPFLSNSWNGIWESATYIGENYWSAEFAIPFYTLNLNNPSGKIDVIGINFTREKKTLPGEDSCWSCTYGSFHHCNQYGHLRNLKIKPTPILIKDIEWGKNAWGENTVAISVMNGKNEPWEGELTLILKGIVSEVIYKSSKIIKINADEAKNILFPYSCKETGKYIALLGYTHEDIFIPLYSRPVFIPSPYENISSDILFYEGDTGYMPMRLNINNPSDYTITIELLSDGQVVKENQMSIKSSKLNLPINIKGLSPGTYSLNIKLIDKEMRGVTINKKLEIIEKY